MIVERGVGGGTRPIAIALLIAVHNGAYQLFSTTGATDAKSDAITGAAKSVGSAVDAVGDAASGGSSSGK